MQPESPRPPVRSAIVLAGGLGTRLRSEVPDLPKPMAPVDGEPFLARLLAHWIARGLQRVVLSVGYRHEAITGYFGHRWQGAEIAYAVESTPMGTGGGLKLAAGQLALAPDERFLLLNGDTYFDVDLARLGDAAERHDADWCFSLFRCSEPGRYMGLDVAGDGRITGLQGSDSGERLANGGVYLVHPRSLAAVAADRPASLENDLFPAFLAGGQRLAGVECAGRFIDIGIPADYRRAATVLPATEGSHAAAH